MDNTDTYKPKYIQLVDLLRHEILTGKLRRGDKLLSENELRDKYNVSSTTVRKCIDILRHEGLIERVQGVGTFVSERPVKRSLEKILSFTKNMQQAGFKPNTEVLEKKVIKAADKYVDMLKVNQRENILRLKRLRFGDGTPMMLETRYINLRFCSGIINEDLAGSLYDVYEKNYGIILARAKQNLKIVFLKENEAGALHCRTGDPAFLVTGVTYSDKSEPIEYEESLYRGDEYEFFVEVGK
ncbi:MAG: GntR family transcriptional regulator [Spirochaetota bacterium]